MTPDQERAMEIARSTEPFWVNRIASEILRAEARGMRSAMDQLRQSGLYGRSLLLSNRIHEADRLGREAEELAPDIAEDVR